jgi:hypothetical protein
VFAYALGTIAYFVAKRYYPNYKNRKSSVSICVSVFVVILNDLFEVVARGELESPTSGL